MDKKKTLKCEKLNISQREREREREFPGQKFMQVQK